MDSGNTSSSMSWLLRVIRDEDGCVTLDEDGDPGRRAQSDVGGRASIPYALMSSRPSVSVEATANGQRSTRSNLVRAV